MSSFVIKLIGLCTMFCDHFNNAVIGHFSYLNLIGRIAFPLFAFQLSQSYTHTKNLTKFLFRLLVFAIISQAPFMLFLSTYTSPLALNIGFTMILGALAILCFDKIPNKFLGLSVCALISILGQIINVDYGAFGIILILLFYIFREKKLWLTISTASCIFINYTISFFIYQGAPFVTYYLPIIFCSCIPLIFINLYNGKRGLNAKYLFYIFYPVHLLLLYFLHYFIQ